MKLTYVIVTHNRREALLKTLRHLYDTTPYSYRHFEVRVVDNASKDGTEKAVRATFPQVKYERRPRNEGVWARSYAFEPAQGEYLILLDDDSYPINDAVTRSLSYLDANPGCAAVVGKVLLPDGTQEGCAFPGVMLSGAVCIRKSVLMKVGGFRPEFFRKAGEYDLSFRIWQAGFTIERFEDVVYNHDKVLTGRSKAFAHRMDLRNNLILVERYLPAKLRAVYRQDVIQRYSALARKDGCGWAAWVARVEGLIWRVREARSGRQTLSNGVVEALYQLEQQTADVRHFVAIHSPAPVTGAKLRYVGESGAEGEVTAGGTDAVPVTDAVRATDAVPMPESVAMGDRSNAVQASFAPVLAGEGVGESSGALSETVVTSESAAGSEAASASETAEEAVASGGGEASGPKPIQRVVIADFSKNLWATFQACDRNGLNILAVADDNSAFEGLTYRGVPVLKLEEALSLRPDVVVVSNVNPAQVGVRAEKVRAKFGGPVLTLYQPETTRDRVAEPLSGYVGDGGVAGSIGLTPAAGLVGSEVQEATRPLPVAA